jgi:hypothetical protein
MSYLASQSRQLGLGMPMSSPITARMFGFCVAIAGLRDRLAPGSPLGLRSSARGPRDRTPHPKWRPLAAMPATIGRWSN